MKIARKKIFLIILIFLIFIIKESYALNNGYSVEFSMEQQNHTKNFYSEYKQIKINNIAPGVEGTINIEIKKSNKDSKYILKFLEEKNKPQNMRFYYKQKEYKSLLELNNYLKGTIKKEEKIDIQIKYVWEYETGNNNYEIEKNDEIDKLDNNKLFEFKILLEAEENIEKSVKEEEHINKKEIKNKTNNIINPKTGDNIYIYLFILIISIMGICIVLIRLKARNRQKM